MDLGQIIDEINKDLDDEIDNAELIGWINRCMDDLSPIVKYQKSAIISKVIGQKEYSLPSDYMRVVQLVDGMNPMNEIPLRDTQSEGYKLWGNQLILQPTPTTTGNLDLYYEGKLPHLVNPDDEPQIPSPFHDLFILYTVAKRQYQDEEENMQMNAWSGFQSRKGELIAFYRKTKIIPIQDVYRYE